MSQKELIPPPMLQKELAALLGITPAAVSQLKRKGMPTHSYQAAVKWRKRHLEPGRVKGSRLDTIDAPRPSPLEIAQRLVILATEDYDTHGQALEEAIDALSDDDFLHLNLPESVAARVFAEDMAREYFGLLPPDDEVEPINPLAPSKGWEGQA